MGACSCQGEHPIPFLVAWMLPPPHSHTFPAANPEQVFRAPPRLRTDGGPGGGHGHLHAVFSVLALPRGRGQGAEHDAPRRRPLRRAGARRLHTRGHARAHTSVLEPPPQRTCACVWHRAHPAESACPTPPRPHAWQFVWIYVLLWFLAQDIIKVASYWIMAKYFLKVCVCSLALMPEAPLRPYSLPPRRSSPFSPHSFSSGGGGGGGVPSATPKGSLFNTVPACWLSMGSLRALCFEEVRLWVGGLASAGQVDNSADRRFASGKTQALIDAEERQHRLRTGTCAARAAPSRPCRTHGTRTRTRMPPTPRPCDRCSLFRQRVAVARLRPCPRHRPCRRGALSRALAFTRLHAVHGCLASALLR